MKCSVLTPFLPDIIALMIFKTEQQAFPKIEPLLKKPRKRKRLTKSERWIILGVFSLTVLASLVAYFASGWTKIRQRITAPLMISNISEEKKFDPSPVLQEIESLTKDLRGVYGVYVYRLKDEREYGQHQAEVFPVASLMKLPVILTLYQEAEDGQINLETKYKLQEKDKIGGAGILQSRTAGTTYTYRQLAEFMGQYSDNTANNVLIGILGDKKIQQTIDELGMEKTIFKDYTTTPQDIGRLFHQLYQGGGVSREHRDEILKFLTKTGFEDRIPTGVPAEVRVAHKIGTEIGVFSDAGIVFARHPFVLVIMSKDAREAEAKEILPKITKAVWEWEQRNSGL